MSSDNSYVGKVINLLLREKDKSTTDEYGQLEKMLINQLQAVLTEMPAMGLFVIKKHFGKLCRSLSNDYQKTIKRLKQLTDLAEEDMVLILSSTDDELMDPVAVNQRILMYLFMNCQSCDQLMNVSTIIEELADPAKRLSVNKFQRDIIFITKQRKDKNADIYSVIEFFSQFEQEGIVIIKKYYSDFLTILPKDHTIMMQELYRFSTKRDSFTSLANLITTCSKESLSKKMMLHLLIIDVNNDYRLLGFSYLLEKFVQDTKSSVIESFRNDCVELLEAKTPSLMQNSITSSDKASQSSTDHPTPDHPAPTNSVEQPEPGVTEFKVLKASYAKLANVLPVKSLSNQLVSEEIITFDEEEEIASIPISKEKASFVLRKIARSLEAGITRSYYALLTIMKDHGGDVAVLASQLSASGTSSTPGLLYQSPPSCPTNYIPRVEILQNISLAVLNSEITPTIGTTVTIRGIGGIGKSSIAKALCHEPLIIEHFTDGFLWISLTPPLPSLTTMLNEVYQRLTDKSAPMNTSILKNKIKSLVSVRSCKLLVILDDVWDAEDAMVLVDVFSSCKIVMTTRKMDINSTISPEKCFDITSMSIDEAVKLLTLKILELETLCDTDISRVKELAKDLHCWPLLLNLVHGQLYVHCIEWNESPQDAILNAHQKLQKHGLTAFDQDSHTSRSRENAVKASITASLGLLSDEEKTMLYHVASSFAGFGVYTCKDVLPAIMKINSEQFDKCAKHLWSQGLVSFESVTLPFISVKIPCIKMHDVIAQYINDEMPNDFYKNHTLHDFPMKLELLFKPFTDDKKYKTGYFYLVEIDVFIIPFTIRSIRISTNLMQRVIVDELTELINSNSDLQRVGGLQKFLDNELSTVAAIKQVHKIIKQDCKSIHTLLVEGKHSEAIAWVEQYFETHPARETLTKTITYLLSLCDLCSDQASKINDLILYYTMKSKVFNVYKEVMIKLIIQHKHILLLINAGAADKDILYYRHMYSSKPL